ICSEGESDVATSEPRAFVRIASMRSLVTVRLTSDSRSATRISRRASLMFSSVRVPWPRRVLKERCSFSERFSNMANTSLAVEAKSKGKRQGAKDAKFRKEDKGKSNGKGKRRGG